MNAPPPEASLRFVQRVLEFWRRYEKYVAAALFVLVAVGEHLNIPVVRESALSVLILIILNQFFDLTQDRVRLKGVLTQISTRVEKLTDTLPQLGQAFTSLEAISNSIRPRKRFKNINEAAPSILECMKESGRADHILEIKWLGMTMWNVWAVLTAVFNDLADEGTVTRLRLNVAILESKWLDDNPINRAWNGARADGSRNNIEKFFEAKRSGGLDWECKIATYAHMPGIHGGLINDRYLFLGMSEWVEHDLHAGERQYSFYTDLTRDDKAKIRIFESWFRVCFEGKRGSSRAAEAGSSS